MFSSLGKNQTAFGKGVYFARDAAYSANKKYSVPEKYGLQYVQHMILVNVVIGTYSSIYIAAPVVLFWSNRSRLAD